MFYEEPVFAELFGLVVTDLAQLEAFRKKHELNEDLLEAFTTLDLGEQVSKEGIAIPITGIEGDYYYLSVCDTQTEQSHLKNEQISVRSEGWTLHTHTGEITVCGIGYLKQFDVGFFTNAAKFAQLRIPRGWNEVTVVGGIDDEARLVYEIRVTHKALEPTFSANFEDDFNILIG